MKNIPGNPQFTATASKDGKGLAGELKQGGGTVPFSLTRIGDAKMLALPSIAGSFDGEHKDGVLTGKWTQGTNTWPLVLKKK